jgi:RNase P/RNase MRP subunit p29
VGFNIASLKAQHSAILKKSERAITEVLDESIDVVNAGIYQRPGFKPVTHKTQDATKARVVRTSKGNVLRVTNNTKRALWLEEGTQPHWIFPRKKKVLRFKGKSGGWVSTKVVKHPGTKPYWFIRGAVSNAAMLACARIESKLARIARDRH